MYSASPALALVFPLMTLLDLMVVFMIWTFLPPPKPRPRSSLLPLSNFARITVLLALALVLAFGVTQYVYDTGLCQRAFDAKSMTFAIQCTQISDAAGTTAHDLQMALLALLCGLPLTLLTGLIAELRARR
jgi:hypothetical protein